MKLRHFAVFGGIFTVIICLLLFLFIVTSDDEESGSSSLDFSGLNRLCLLLTLYRLP